MCELVAGLHQPNFLPYLGFFDKLRSSDIFVIRDEVLFVKKDFHQRNRIRINSNDNINNPQSKWIRVPVVEILDYISHVSIKKDSVRDKMPWNQKIIHDISASYEGSRYFSKFFPRLKQIFESPPENLITLNMELINFLKDAFDIRTKVILASELGLKPLHYVKSDASQDIVDICKKVDAGVYLSGKGAKDYLREEPFKKAGIKVVFQDYDHPTYDQRFPGFLPYMSALDALFCVGSMPLKEGRKVCQITCRV